MYIYVYIYMHVYPPAFKHGNEKSSENRWFPTETSIALDSQAKPWRSHPPEKGDFPRNGPPKNAWWNRGTQIIPQLAKGFSQQIGISNNLVLENPNSSICKRSN